MTNPVNKGVSTSPSNPGRSPLMLWIRAHLAYQGESCLIWPFGRRRNGYGAIYRQGKGLDAHRYICKLVHGEPPSPQHHAAHSCGRGYEGCVNPRHLSWKTNSENQLDRRAHGTDQGKGKLTPQQVIEIRGLKGQERVTLTAARFGVSEVNIRHI